MKVRWEDVLAGYPDEHMHFEADASDGYFKVTMNDRAIFEGSQSDAFVTFIALSRLFGPKLSKSLLKIRLDGERLTNDG